MKKKSANDKLPIMQILMSIQELNNELRWLNCTDIKLNSLLKWSLTCIRLLVQSIMAPRTAHARIQKTLSGGSDNVFSHQPILQRGVPITLKKRSYCFSGVNHTIISKNNYSHLCFLGGAQHPVLLTSVCPPPPPPPPPLMKKIKDITTHSLCNTDDYIGNSLKDSTSCELIISFFSLVFVGLSLHLSHKCRSTKIF